MTEQLDIFREQVERDYPAEQPSQHPIDISIAEQYAEWSKLPGTRHIKKHFYAITAAYVDEWKQTGVQVSSRLIAELVRHKVKHRMTRAERMDINLSKWNGYSLNNIFTPTLSRRVMEKRPDWNGIFELRY